MDNQNTNNLDLLATFHYVVAGITGLLSCLPFLHVFMGLAVLSGQFNDSNNQSGPPAIFGLMFVIMGSIFILLGWALAIAMLVAAKKLKQRKNRTLCMVVAGIECCLMPFGTVLGVFSLIELTKDSVKQLFDEQENK